MFLVAGCSDHCARRAVSLRPNKATDNTVCDLTHDTNAYTSSMVLVPAVASQTDQVDALYRLAANFVASKCANGQLLMLQGSSDVNVDARRSQKLRTQRALLLQWCEPRLSGPLVNGRSPALNCGAQWPGAREQLVQMLADLERADPMNSLKARMQAAVLAEERGWILVLALLFKGRRTAASSPSVRYFKVDPASES